MGKTWLAALVATLTSSSAVAMAQQDADGARPSVKVESGLLSGVAGRDQAITVYKGVP
jgi:hypothetical protein